MTWIIKIQNFALLGKKFSVCNRCSAIFVSR